MTDLVGISAGVPSIIFFFFNIIKLNARRGAPGKCSPYGSRELLALPKRGNGSIERVDARIWLPISWILRCNAEALRLMPRLMSGKTSTLQIIAQHCPIISCLPLQMGDQYSAILLQKLCRHEFVSRFPLDNRSIVSWHCLDTEIARLCIQVCTSL